MRNLFFFAAFLLAAFNAQAQTVNDEQEIQAFTRRFMAAYNAQDHAAIGKMYTDDAVRIDPEGKEIKGADNIAAFFAEQFRKNNATLLLKHSGISWSDAQHAWIAKGNYEVYGKTYVYDINIDITGRYENAMLKKNGEWKIARSWLSKPNMEVVKNEIQDLENEWARASANKDVAAIVAFYADDAVSMTNNKPMIKGKATIQKELEADFAKRKDAVASVAYETMEVYGNETVVTETGKTTVKDTTGKLVYTGKYMVVWQKRDGKWLVACDIYNDDEKEK